MRAQIALLRAKSSARSPLVRGHYSEGVGTLLEQAAGEITACDLHVLITGEEAALPFQTALGDDAVVGVAGKEADGGLIRRHLVGANYAAPE
jgi:hypothetical protein